MKLNILFLMLTVQVSAQNLKYIPDINLRNELTKQVFMTNDSLDLGKIQGLLQLELNGKEIENLDGLQYFDQVWLLSISRNKIKQLENLPPNLTHLDCSYNKISVIKNLPRSLVSLIFSNNQLTDLPQLTNKIQYINYSNNPIPFGRLPALYQNVSCDYPYQNCLPYGLMKWKILNATVKDTSLKITGMKIIFHSHDNSRYDLGYRDQVETIEFKRLFKFMFHSIF